MSSKTPTHRSTPFTVSEVAGRRRPKNAWLRVRARELRSQPTQAEAVLWSAIRGRRLDGFKFRRQHVVGNYIVDFCCISQRLCIELDGGCHRETRAYDAVRDAWIQAHDLRVLRFENVEVLEHLEQVLRRIRNALH